LEHFGPAQQPTLIISRSAAQANGLGVDAVAKVVLSDGCGRRFDYFLSAARDGAAARPYRAHSTLFRFLAFSFDP
jgi:hypothetical protein